MNRALRLAASASTGLALLPQRPAARPTSTRRGRSSAVAAPASKSCADDTTATSTDAGLLQGRRRPQVELDKPAERIAVLEWQQVEDALTLCVTPTAVSDAKGYSTWVSAEKLPDGRHRHRHPRGARPRHPLRGRARPRRRRGLRRRRRDHREAGEARRPRDGHPRGATRRTRSGTCARSSA